SLVVVDLCLVLGDDLLEVDDVLFLALDQEARSGLEYRRRRERVHEDGGEDEQEHSYRGIATLVQHPQIVQKVRLVRRGHDVGGPIRWRLTPTAATLKCFETRLGLGL